MTEYKGGEIATIIMRTGDVYEGAFYDRFNDEWVTETKGRLYIQDGDKIIVNNRAVPAGRVGVTKAEIAAAVKEISDIIGIGERGTRGDYTEAGALYYVLDALGIRLTVVDQ